MKKNKKQREAAKVAGVSKETKENIKAAVNVSSQEKAKPAETSEDKPKKKKKTNTSTAKTDKLDGETAKTVVKAITKEKELLYNYPVECDTLELRKKFRAEVRRKIASHEKEIAKLSNSELPEDKILLETKSKAHDKYAKLVLANPRKSFATIS